MQILKTYEYIFSEDDLRQLIVDIFNKKHNKHLPITKSNVTIKLDKQPYDEPTVKAVITIDEEGD